MKFSKSMKVGVGLLVGAAALTGGTAFALWTSSGVGSGNAKALSAVSITVTANTSTPDLFPGFTQGKVAFTSANTNPYPVTFTSMTPGVITSSDPTNCPATNVSVASASGLSLLVPAGATAQAGSIGNVVSMVAGAPDGCQGVVFTVALTLTGSQS